MRKAFILPVLALFVIISVAIISAFAPVCDIAEATQINGVIYNQNTEIPIGGADVTVNCNGNVKTTTSNGEGAYGVDYLFGECDAGDNVTVYATGNGLSSGLSGEETKTVIENSTISVGGCLNITINVACINVPLIPEFGLLVGTLTLASAVGVFFLVRRK